MQHARSLMFATVLFAGMAYLFTVPGASSAMAQQPQCWDQSTNRLRDMVPGSITGDGHSADAGDRRSRDRTVHRDDSSGRVLGFQVC
jgi:hypothetical protein